MNNDSERRQEKLRMHYWVMSFLIIAGPCIISMLWKSWFGK